MSDTAVDSAANYYSDPLSDMLNISSRLSSERAPLIGLTCWAPSGPATAHAAKAASRRVRVGRV